MEIVNDNGSYQKYPFIMINKILKWQFPNILSPRAEKQHKGLKDVKIMCLIQLFWI